METTPDELWSPDAVDPYNLVPDLARMQDTVQDALVARNAKYLGQMTRNARDAISGANLYRGLLVYNFTDSSLDAYSGTSWFSVGALPVTGTITGGTTNTVWDATLKRIGKRVTLEGKVEKTSGAFAGGYLAPAEGLVPVGFRAAATEVFMPVVMVTTGGDWLAGVAYMTSGNIQVNLHGDGGIRVIGFNAFWDVP